LDALNFKNKKINYLYSWNFNDKLNMTNGER
jgi:hypothetical protein